MNEICKKNHRYNKIFEKLSESQGGKERHLCAGCAYEQGYSHRFNDKENNMDSSLLLESQAGTGRHKDASEAYQIGYVKGKKDRMSK